MASLWLSYLCIHHDCPDAAWPPSMHNQCVLCRCLCQFVVSPGSFVFVAQHLICVLQLLETHICLVQAVLILVCPETNLVSGPGQKWTRSTSNRTWMPLQRPFPVRCLQYSIISISRDTQDFIMAAHIVGPGYACTPRVNGCLNVQRLGCCYTH